MLSRNKEVSSKQEKLVAKYLSWNVVSGSGARPTRCGDIISSNWVGECKTHQTVKSKIVFQVKWWSKLCDEAASLRKYPVLIVDDGSQSIEHSWCMFYSTFDTPGANFVEVECKNHSSISLDDEKLKNICKESRNPLTLFITILPNEKRYVCISSLETFRNLVFGDY